MTKKLPLYCILFLSFFQHTFAQQPKKPTASEIYNQIEKLNFLGSALYIAAHPDDENTRLISFLANNTKARTGYLSLTRGDGGQNLIGTQLRELLGVIRTQELIEARKTDGGEQFFSRANDFGYSKVPTETLEIWDKEKVMSDMAWIIRNFQPDIIINRFDHRSPGTTHGHHTSSAMLSQDLFSLASDPNFEPSQLQFVKPWQPKRLFFNVSWWFFGGKDKFEKADKSKYVNLRTGVYYPSLGKSNQEIAALSRSKHQSQGFGSTGVRGEDMEYLELIKGNSLTDQQNLFEGIDTSWKRVKGGAPIGETIDFILKCFDFKNPSASVFDLTKVYQQISQLEDTHWKKIKLEEVKNIIASCAGLYLEAVADEQSVTPGGKLKVKWEAINRSPVAMKLLTLQLAPQNETLEQSYPLKNNLFESETITITVPKDLPYTSPYWLNEKGSTGMYTVNEQQKIGVPDIIRNLDITFTILVEEVEIPFTRKIIYKYNDPVKGEVYHPLDIVPQVTTEILNKVQLFKDRKKQSVAIKVKAGKDDCSGTLQLELPSGWIVTPEYSSFQLNKKGSEKNITFEVSPPDYASEVTAKAVATVEGQRFDRQQVIIDYPHIALQQVLLPAEAKFTKADIETKGKNIAYIMGAGDQVPQSLQQMGYNVTLLQPEKITSSQLEKFDAVIMGIRAYNVVETLQFKQPLLFEYVRNGGTMIVQYNTTGALITQDIAPYPLEISSDRVTEENATVTFLDPKNKVLNYPNKITSNDFKGWVQEQGLYYPDKWSSEFTPILQANDKGETPKKGALLVAPYGKGHYIYTGLSFFRELPEGVSGAFRLMANLIAVGK